MRLVVLLDESLPPAKIGRQDIVITIKSEDIKKYRNSYKTYIAKNYNSQDTELRQAVIKYFENQSDLIKLLQNNMFTRSFTVAANVLEIAEGVLLEYDINRILLVGGCEYPYLTFYSGYEGKKWWYKCSWIVNAFLYSKFHDIYDIEWIKKESQAKVKVRHCIRENLLYVKEILGAIKRWMQDLKAVYNDNVDCEDLDGFVLCRLKLQYVHLKDKMTHLTSRKFVYLTFNKEIAKLPEAYYMKAMGPKDIFGLVGIVNHNQYFGTRLQWSGGDFYFPQKHVHRICKAALFLRLWNKKQIQDALIDLNAKKGQLLIENEHGQIYYALTRELGLKHIFIQYARHGKEALPKKELADKFLLYSWKSFLYDKSFSDTYEFFSEQYDEIEYVPLANRSIKYTFFADPDDFERSGVQFLEKMCELVLKHGLENQIMIQIKYHYRQKHPELFRSVIKRFPFVLEMQSVTGTEALKQSDVMMSYCSSVFAEAVLYGVPGIVIDFDEVLEQDIMDNEYIYEDVNFWMRSYEEFEDFILEPEKYRKLYFNRRSSFIKNRRNYVLDSSRFEQIVQSI